MVFLDECELWSDLRVSVKDSISGGCTANGGLPLILMLLFGRWWEKGAKRAPIDGLQLMSIGKAGLKPVPTKKCFGANCMMSNPYIAELHVPRRDCVEVKMPCPPTGE
jgi:hypothetical protein